MSACLSGGLWPAAVRLGFGVLALWGCSDTDRVAVEDQAALDDPLQAAHAFIADREYRRHALLSSLIDSNNGYARLRLEHYATDPTDAAQGSWDALPEVRPLSAKLLHQDGQRVTGPASAVERSTPESPTELLELGRRAFEMWPSQSFAELDLALDDTEPTAAARFYGLWIDADGWVGGVVRASYETGLSSWALTCASCHARPGPDGVLRHGPASDIDLGWGPGKVDVTADGSINPVAVPDLRATVHQSRLHWTGNVENGLTALAVRIDTLLITSSGSTVRAPREIALALALYVQSLGLDPAPSERASDVSNRGSQLFGMHCAGCHFGATGEGAWVGADVVGTDPALAKSSMRGTGGYRVPSLHAIASRSRFTHQGFDGTLDELFDPGRLDVFTGHDFGLDLSQADRAALVDFISGF